MNVTQYEGPLGFVGFPYQGVTVPNIIKKPMLSSENLLLYFDTLFVTVL